MRVVHPIFGEHHARDDGTIPCTNCDKDVKYSVIRMWWIHTDSTVACAVTPYEGEEACPLPPGDEDYADSDPADYPPPGYTGAWA